jgi:glycerol-3-phosphate O-acyltransferase / dihydroxyacetone phosphate acyltransferase
VHRLSERGMKALAQVLIHVFFRRVELQHAARLPASGPVVLVANHTNGLVDGLLLLATLGRYPRFLGKSTLFKIPPLWPFLKFAGVIPVYRLIDGATGERNVSAFATCHEILARGGTVALFPEGISHDESSLQPLRTGAARIALEAGIESGVPGVVTVAVGLTYDAKARFRSRALVRVGQPVPVAGWAEAYQRDAHEAVRQFTAAVVDQLNLVSPPYESWAEAERMGAIARVMVRSPEGSLPQDVALADQAGVADRLARVGDDRRPKQALLAAFGAYQRDLDLLGLDDAQVTARYPAGTLRRTLVWSVLKVLVALPFAVLGVVVHVVPFQLMKRLARLPANEGIKATVKLLGCFILFVIVYAALGVLAGRAFGAWVGLAVAVAAPGCGYVAVRLGERAQRIGGLLEGYRTVRDRRGVLRTVVARRAEVVRAAAAVLALP